MTGLSAGANLQVLFTSIGKDKGQGPALTSRFFMRLSSGSQGLRRRGPIARPFPGFGRRAPLHGVRALRQILRHFAPKLLTGLP